MRSCAPPDRLLDYNVKEGWPSLCKFLNLSIPNEEFPFRNQSANQEQTAKFVQTLMATHIRKCKIEVTMLHGQPHGLFNIILDWNIDNINIFNIIFNCLLYLLCCLSCNLCNKITLFNTFKHLYKDGSIKVIQYLRTCGLNNGRLLFRTYINCRNSIRNGWQEAFLLFNSCSTLFFS